MSQRPKYYIVEASALPEIYLKVADAKRMLETGEAHTVNDAARRVGISRSAFYKYKDAVRPFRDMASGRIITVQVIVRNEPGSLSAVLNVFAEWGGNVLTINQAIPGDASAAVIIGVETPGMDANAEELLASLRAKKEVVRCEVIAG